MARKTSTSLLFVCVAMLMACSSQDMASPKPASSVSTQVPAGEPQCAHEAASPVDTTSFVIERLPGVELWFQDSVPTQDRDWIKAGVASAQSFITAKFASPLPALVCVKVLSPGEGPIGMAQARNGQVLIVSAPEGWPDKTSWSLPSVAAHEYVHVWQREVAGAEGFDNSAIWLSEGMAQWISLQAMLESRLLSAEELERESANKDGPLTPQLQMLESGIGWHASLLNYQVSLSAVNLLVERGSPLQLLRYVVGLGQAMPWQEAFLDAFGLTTADFYVLFSDQ